MNRILIPIMKPSVFEFPALCTKLINMHSKFKKEMDKMRRQELERIVGSKRRAAILVATWKKSYANPPKTTTSQGFHSDYRCSADFEAFTVFEEDQLRKFASFFMRGLQDEKQPVAEPDLAQLREKVNGVYDKQNILQQLVADAPQLHEDHMQVVRHEVVALQRQNLKIGEIAALTGLTVGQVKTTLRVYRTAGAAGVETLGTRRKGRPRKLTRKHLTFLEATIINQEGDMTLAELTRAARAAFFELRNCSISTIRSALTVKLGFSKRLVPARDKRMHSQDRESKLRIFLTKLSDYILQDVEVWSTDECCIWIGRRKQRRWIRRMNQVFCTGASRALEKLTLLLSVSSHGRYFGQFMRGSACTRIFAKFLGMLAAYSGGAPKVALLDNASFHKTALSKGAASASGFDILYTVPYTPESNYVELIFGLLKRRLLDLVVVDVADIVQAVQITLERIPGHVLKASFIRSYKDVASLSRVN